MSKEKLNAVSVIVLTYKPLWEKLVITLRSVIMQEQIKLQIVVTDDGSEDNLFEKIISFFAENKFDNYILVSSELNRGTVENTYRGVEVCSGKYVKLISPGDYLPRKNTLYEWSKHLSDSNYKWSIGEAIYYKRGEDNLIKPIAVRTNPMVIDVYLKRKEKKIRWNYVVLDDTALGAAVLCEREIFGKYINRIVGKVVYVEDNVYRLMMFDGILADYFPDYSVVYEYGEGISTGGNDIWRERMVRDFKAANEEMFRTEEKLDRMQKFMKRCLTNRNKGNIFVRYIRKIFEPGRVVFTLKEKYRIRYSMSELPEDIERFEL